MEVYEYTDSDIQWIGDIPKHWKIDRIKDVSSETSFILINRAA